MELGTESRNKVIAACTLGAIALVTITWAVWPASSSSAAVVPPLVAHSAQPAATTGKKTALTPASLDPTLRYDWLKSGEGNKYEGTGKNIFVALPDIPPPVAHAELPPQPPPGAQQNLPPVPPPINLKFYGFATEGSAPKKVFLSEGDDIFIASEGDIIDRRYKVLHIYPMAVEIEDVLNNNRQQIPLTQG